MSNTYIGTIKTNPRIINNDEMFAMTFDLLSGGDTFPCGLFGPNGRHWLNNLKKGNLIIARCRRVYGQKTGRVCLVVRNISLRLEDALGKNLNVVV